MSNWLTLCDRHAPPPQTGKSGGSILQQALLVVSAGAISGPILPLLFAFYLAMLRGWRGAVHELSSRRRYTLNSPVHTFEEDDEEGLTWSPPPGGAALAPSLAAGGAAVVAAPPRPAGMPDASQQSGGSGGSGSGASSP